MAGTPSELFHKETAWFWEVDGNTKLTDVHVVQHAGTSDSVPGKQNGTELVS
jgi:hypothetical protein